MRATSTIALLAIVAISTVALAQDRPLPPPKPEGVGQLAQAAPDAPADSDGPAGPRPAPKPDGEPDADAAEAEEGENEPAGTGADENASPEPKSDDTDAEEGSGEAEAEPDTIEETADEPVAEEEAEEEEVPAVQQPLYDEAEAMACERDLAAMGIKFKDLEPIDDEYGCGTPRPLRVTAVGDVAIEPAVTVRCPVAKALGLWINEVVVPSATLHLGEEPTVVATGGSYECRQRVGGEVVRFSEHASANAIDIVSVGFAGRAAVPIEPRLESSAPERPFQAAIRGGACAYFTTVLGPMTNEAHADHIHVDLAERRGGYRLCE